MGRSRIPSGAVSAAHPAAGFKLPLRIKIYPSGGFLYAQILVPG